MSHDHIQWRDSYDSRFDTIDGHHRKLIGLINGVMDRLAADCPVSDIRYYLAEIHHLIETHFQEEEVVMRSIRFAGYAAHKSDHDRLLLEIRDLIRMATEDRLSMSKGALASAMDDWFSVHFRTYDRAFHYLSPEETEAELPSGSGKNRRWRDRRTGPAPGPSTSWPKPGKYRCPSPHRAAAPPGPGPRGRRGSPSTRRRNPRGAVGRRPPAGPRPLRTPSGRDDNAL